MILPGERVFVACSGGPDSVALFHLLHSLKVSWKLKLGLLHFNHGLRGKKSDYETKFVRKMAAVFHVPFYSQKHRASKKRGKKESLEEAARGWRYDFLIREARRRRIPKIAMAHTSNDQAETVMMRILQGTGLRGLEGIRPTLVKEKIMFVRPLLPFSKDDILRFLNDRRIPFCKDASNGELRFLRNRIRLELFPHLARRYNPRVIEALARIPAIVCEENKLLSDLEEIAWKKTIQAVRRKKLTLDRSLFMKFPSSLQFRMVDRALRKIDSESGASFEAWQTFRPKLALARTRTSFPRDIDLALTPSKLVLYKKPPRR